MSPSPSPRLSRSYLQTACAHSGCDVNASHSRDVVAPIHLATTYERSAPNPLQHPPTSTDPTIAPRGTDGGVCGYPGGYCYSRLANPTRNALERVLTDLDDGLASQAYASGMAAASAILSALAPGDHVIFGVDLYAGVKGVRGMLCDARNVKWDAANAASKEDIVRKIQPSTKLVWVESVGNPMCSVADVRGIRDAIQTLGMASPPLIVVDATWASQFVSRPLLHGADIVLHSLTKYIAGHSDCLGGALIRTRTSTPALDKMWTMACNACTIAGSALDPFTCYMVMRGIRSLWCRIKVQCANAMEVATWLSHHPRVSCARWIKPLTCGVLRECASLCWHATRPAAVAGTASPPSRAHPTRPRQCLVATHSCDRTVLKLCWPWPCRPNPRRAFRYTLSCSPQSRLRTLSRMGASARPEASISSASARRS